tara:strand:- start:1985 stop:2395 length:411 start_codon:yes stop_codon:yes gene_type:complete
MTKTKLTGPELDEKFFVWKGWVKDESISVTHGMWVLPDGTIWAESTDKFGEIRKKELPQIDKSLDLQEEWLWPELYKVDITQSYFIKATNGGISCFLQHNQDNGWPWDSVLYADSATKALAQLTAGLKALGVDVAG